MTRALLLCFAVLTLPSCVNMWEALHQTSPGYQSPVPLSKPWWEQQRRRHPEADAEMDRVND